MVPRSPNSKELKILQTEPVHANGLKNLWVCVWFSLIQALAVQLRILMLSADDKNSKSLPEIKKEHKNPKHLFDSVLSIYTDYVRVMRWWTNYLWRMQQVMPLFCFLFFFVFKKRGINFAFHLVFPCNRVWLKSSQICSFPSRPYFFFLFRIIQLIFSHLLMLRSMRKQTNHSIITKLMP